MEINGTYFRGDPAPDRSKSGHSANSISPGSHKSWMHIAPTVTSWPYNLSMPSAPYILSTPQNGEFAVMKTANKIFATPISDYRKYRYFSQEYDFHMDSWIDAGNKIKPAMFDEVPIAEKSGNSYVAVSFGEKQARFMHGDTYLRKFVSDIEIQNWPLNNIGVAFHKAHNAKYDLMKYYSSENGRELIDYLKSIGCSPAIIDEIGIVNSDDAGIYGVAKLANGRVVFIAHENAKDMLARWGNRFGASLDEMVEFAIDEEEIHLARGFGRNTDVITDETQAKETALDFYGERIPKSQGDKKRSYQRKARIRIDDIETVPQRYKNNSRHSEDISSLVNSWKAEAREKGIDPTEYISAHLAKNNAYSRRGRNYETEAKDGKYGGKAVKSGNKGEEKSGERELHRIAAESEKDSDGKPEGNGNPEAGESQEASN